MTKGQPLPIRYGWTRYEHIYQSILTSKTAHKLQCGAKVPVAENATCALVAGPNHTAKSGQVTYSSRLEDYSSLQYITQAWQKYPRGHQFSGVQCSNRDVGLFGAECLTCLISTSTGTSARSLQSGLALCGIILCSRSAYHANQVSSK